VECPVWEGVACLVPSWEVAAHGSVLWEGECNAPTGVKGQTLAKRVRLLGKLTESYGEPAMIRCC